MNHRLFKSILFKYREILKDTFSLTVLQVANQIIPLIIIPFLTTKLGIENYGLIAVSLAVINGLKILIDFGFDLTGTDFISKNKNQKDIVSNIYSSIISLKLCLCIFISVILFIVLSIIDLQEYDLVLKFLLLWLLGEVFFPRYLFQGYNLIKLITVFSILSKLVMVIIVLFFLKNENDILIYPIALGVGSLFANTIAIIYLKVFKNISPFTMSIQRIKSLFVLSYRLVASRLLVFSYSNSLIFLVNFIYGESYSGIFSVCQKITGGISGFLNPVSEAIFPKMSLKFSNNKYEYFNKFNLILKYSFFLSLFMVVVLNLFKSQILNIFLTEVNDETLLFFSIISLSLISSQLGNFFTQFFVITLKTNLFLINVTVTLVITILLTLALSSLLGFIGVSIGLILGQIIHLGINFYFKRNLCADL
jgi:PST family polysaccharide transporter